MTLEEFRQEVFAHLGPDLDSCTPEEVQRFLGEMQARLHPPKMVEGRIVIDTRDASLDFDRVVLDFFAAMLKSPPEPAVINLWLFSFETWFYSQEQEELRSRFAELVRDALPPKEENEK